MSPPGKDERLILDKTYIFECQYCYIYRRGDTQAKFWQFYFWDEEGKEGFRIRKSLKTKDFRKAKSMAETEYLNIRHKIQNNETLKPLFVKEMAEIFLEGKRKIISSSPHAGVTPETFRILKNRCEKLILFLGANTSVDQIKRDAFMGYEQWRLLGNGGKVPATKTTIKTELSTFKSILRSIAIKEKRAISQLPDFPEIRVPPKENKHRRNHFREEELQVFIQSVKQWKNTPSNRESTATHRKIMAYAIELLLASGMRIGALKKLKWRDIRINSRDKGRAKNQYRLITVESDNNKTGKHYTCNCECGVIVDSLRAISAYNSPSDLLFCNQQTGKIFSSRAWSDAWNAIIKISNLGYDTGRNFSYYSLRHTYITTALANKVPLQLLAKNVDTSTKYIEEHYYHHEPELLTEELNPVKRKRIASGEEMFRMHHPDAS